MTELFEAPSRYRPELPELVMVLWMIELLLEPFSKSAPSPSPRLLATKAMKVLRLAPER